MSRMHLNQIQSQLKTAIQNHQILVSRIQLKPQDMGIKTQLHNLQKEIMVMSQKQKLIVEKLRKELMERKTSHQDDEMESNTQNHKIEMNLEDPSKSTSCLLPNTPSLSESIVSKANQTSTAKSSAPPLRIPQYPSQKTPQSQNNSSASHKPESKVHHSQILNRKPSISKEVPVNKDTRPTNEVTAEEKERQRKLEFMASIDLLPPESVKEMQGKRSERKRRSTNNPNFAYGFELERRPRLSNFLASEYFGAKKPKGRPRTTQSPSVSRPTSPGAMETNGDPSHLTNSKENTPQGSVCISCGQAGQLIMCDTCSGLYHLQCLTPPLTTVPKGHWLCPSCQESSQKSAMSLAAVNTYIANKTGKEEEKRKLLKKSTELLQEKTHLENRTKQLNEILARQGIHKQELVDINKKAQESVEKLKTFVKAVQSS